MRNRAGLHRVIPRVILEPLSDLIKTSEWFNVTFVYRYTQTVTRKARCCLVARPVFIVLSVVRCILGKTETYPVLSTTLGVLTFPGSCKKRKRNQFFGVNVEDLTMPTGVRIDGWERHKKVYLGYLGSKRGVYFAPYWVKVVKLEWQVDDIALAGGTNIFNLGFCGTMMQMKWISCENTADSEAKRTVSIEAS